MTCRTAVNVDPATKTFDMHIILTLSRPIFVLKYKSKCQVVSIINDFGIGE